MKGISCALVAGMARGTEGMFLPPHRDTQETRARIIATYGEIEDWDIMKTFKATSKTDPNYNFAFRRIGNIIADDENSSGQIGIARREGLLGWKIEAFMRDADSDFITFNWKNSEHDELLRAVRPLTVRFSRPTKNTLEELKDSGLEDVSRKLLKKLAQIEAPNSDFQLKEFTATSKSFDENNFVFHRTNDIIVKDRKSDSGETGIAKREGLLGWKIEAWGIPGHDDFTFFDHENHGQILEYVRPLTVWFSSPAKEMLKEVKKNHYLPVPSHQFWHGKDDFVRAVSEFEKTAAQPFVTVDGNPLRIRYIDGRAQSRLVRGEFVGDGGEFIWILSVDPHVKNLSQKFDYPQIIEWPAEYAEYYIGKHNVMPTERFFNLISAKMMAEKGIKLSKPPSFSEPSPFVKNEGYWS